jgi:4-diphosphocytidyl-2-C-methyl-D-erythritol kinase
VFHTISLADTIQVDFEPARRTVLELEDSAGIPDNLILKAAESVLAAMKLRAHVRFRLTKRIPMGGGLGGGSSNAAAVLLALPVLAGKWLPLEQLEEMGARLGSDVPFFLTGGAAFGLGRGTELYELPDLRAEPLLLFEPGFAVSTAEAYRALGRGPETALETGAAAGTSETLTVADGLSRLRSFRAYHRTLGEVRSAAHASRLSANDFETAVFFQHPKLEQILRKAARSGALGARMTGSGSTVFALYESRAAREEAHRRLRQDRALAGCRILPANLVSRSGFRRLWRRQLGPHIRSGAGDGSKAEAGIWPLHSKHG